MKLNIEAGQKFGRLITLERDYSKGTHDTWWRCRCDCGNLTSVRSSHLYHGRAQSCGCIRTERLIKMHYKHGQSGTSIHNVWMSMHERCKNPNSTVYDRYGGRGIKVCDEWREFTPFFYWAKSNGYREGMTIDRINNDGNYSPDNCRWVDMKAQCRNRSNTYYVCFRGEMIPLISLCDKYNISYQTARQRIKKLHWNVEDAVTIPAGGKYNGSKSDQTGTGTIHKHNSSVNPG